jgi:hypothetical protein
MVSRKDAILTWLLLTTQPARAAEPLLLHWSGSKDAGCRLLVETFLSELRSVALDRTIELEAFSREGRAGGLGLECDRGKTPTQLLVREPGLRRPEISMRFLSRSRGFDAEDWLSFQQRYLRPAGAPPERALSEEREPVLSPVARDEDTRISTATAATPGAESKPLLRRWWFWALVASAAITAVALTSGAASEPDPAD